MATLNEVNDIKLALDQTGKGMIKRLVELCKTKASSLRTMVDLACTQEPPYCWRATWILVHTAMDSKHLLEPYMDKFIKHLVKSHYTQQQASGLRLVKIMAPDLSEHAVLIDFCMKLLVTPTKTYHAKYYSLQLLRRFALLVPELGPEIAAQVQIAMDHFEKQYVKREAKELLKFLATSK